MHRKKRIMHSIIALALIIMTGTMFTVSSGAATKNAKKAADWAIKIANDNSYVAKKETDESCHKCNSKKAKGYSHSSFVRAAFAHGAGNKTMLADCKAGKTTHPRKLYKQMKANTKEWSSKGRLSKSKLQKGDVVFYRVNKGAEPKWVGIYVGDNKIAIASNAQHSSAKKTIHVWNYSKVMKTYYVVNVMRYKK